jgi:hypothetical protein
MFGRVASYRFHDVPTDGRYNLALSQSQLDSACLYERYFIQFLFCGKPKRIAFVYIYVCGQYYLHIYVVLNMHKL